jgi:hypothetical protein
MWFLPYSAPSLFYGFIIRSGSEEHIYEARLYFLFLRQFELLLMFSYSRAVVLNRGAASCHFYWLLGLF